MLDVAPTELLLVAFVALVVIGPKDLPKTLRVVGHWVGRARGVARQFRSGFDTMVREAEVEEMEKRWASENARIMREHGDAGTASGDATHPAPAVDAPAVDAPPADAAPAAESSSHGDDGHDPFGTEPDALHAPVMTEKPHVTPAETPASKPEGAAS